LWPHPLRAVRTDYVATSIPTALLLICAYLGALAATWRRLPGLAAGLLFFAVSIIPSLPLVTRLANAQVLAERYVYLPSVGLTIALAFGLALIEKHFGPRALLGAAAVVALVLLLQTRNRNQDWHSTVALFEAEVAAAPDNREAVLDLGMAYTGIGRTTES